MRAILYFVFAALVGFLASCSGSTVAQLNLDDQIRTASDDPGASSGDPAVDPLYVFYNSEDDDLE
jgi:hypothetical protein